MAAHAGPGLRPAGPARAQAPTLGGLAAYLGEVAREAEAAAARAGGWIEHDLELAGTRVRVRFAGPALVDVLLPPLAHLRAGAGDVSASIAVLDSASTGVPLPPVPWDPTTVDARGRVAESTEAVTAFHNVHFGGVTLFDLEAGEGIVWAPSAERIPWYERGSPLRTALHLALPGTGRHLIHAGAVGHGTGGLLIGGRSGSGKSTLTLACVEAGFGYAGDDYVLVTLDPEPVAHCLYTTAKVDPASLRRLPALAGAVNPAASVAEKAVLELSRTRADRIRNRVPVTAVVLPRVTGRTQLRSLGAGEALRDLGPSTVIQMPHRSGELLASTAELLARVPSYRLELGGDLRAAVDLLRGLLEDA